MRVKGAGESEVVVTGVVECVRVLCDEIRSHCSQQVGHI